MKKGARLKLRKHVRTAVATLLGAYFLATGVSVPSIARRFVEARYALCLVPVLPIRMLAAPAEHEFLSGVLLGI